jgi:hypothetical protein
MNSTSTTVSLFDATSLALVRTHKERKAAQKALTKARAKLASIIKNERALKKNLNKLRPLSKKHQDFLKRLYKASGTLTIARWTDDDGAGKRESSGYLTAISMKARGLVRTESQLQSSRFVVTITPEGQTMVMDLLSASDAIVINNDTSSPKLFS